MTDSQWVSQQKVRFYRVLYYTVFALHWLYSFNNCAHTEADYALLSKGVPETPESPSIRPWTRIVFQHALLSPLFSNFLHGCTWFFPIKKQNWLQNRQIPNCVCIQNILYWAFWGHTINGIITRDTW